MSEIKINNIPNMTVSKMISCLGDMYSKAINNNMEISKLPSVMLWGPPGVGKSQGVKGLAKEIEYATNKKVKVTDVRLLLFNPIDLRGIPTSNEDKTLAVWLKPKIFDMDSSDDVINILFLDEISAAPQSVQAAAYQITLDHTVGEHKLPNNCIVIAAGNRVTDKSVAYKMPKALANRLLHIEIDSNFEAWKKWAISSSINSKVVGFLSFKPNYLMNFDSQSEDLAYATPRSWEMVSNILNIVNDDIKVMKPLIAGLVSSGVAIEFLTWAEVYNELPNIDSIFNGAKPDVPKNTSVLYALISSLISKAHHYKDDIDKIENAIDYAINFPPDFATVFLKDLMYIEKDYKLKLIKIPAFTKWMNKRGKLLNELN